jgi:hypothetical protein
MVHLADMTDNSKDFQNMVTMLRSRLNPELTKVKSFYEQGIVIAFKNGFNLLITPLTPKNKFRPYFSCAGLSVIQDEDFFFLKKIVYKEKLEPSYENGSKHLFNIIQAFSSRNSKNALKYYKSIFPFELKSLLNDHFKLGLDPAKEYFLYGNDELRPRFSQSKEIKVPKKGLRCKIDDDSAIIIYKPECRIIELTEPFHCYQDKKYIYIGKIFHYKKCKAEDSTYIQFNGKTEKRTYMKAVLNKGVDLKKQERFAYKKANQMEFVLKQDSKGIFSLWDKDGEVIIVHPDLLIRIL